MTAPVKIDSLLVEFHRFGPSDGVPRKGEPYIRTAGWEEPAREVVNELTLDQFMRCLGALRMRGTRPEEVKQALGVLAGQADRMLAPLDLPANGTLVHIDLVTNAAELWAFPFESWMDPTPVFASRDRKVVLTRRIRGVPAESDFTWPSEPRILFAHAPVASDLSQALIDDQIAALEGALLPWTKGKALGATELLTVRTVRGPWDLEEARQEAAYTHIHILAHGGPVEDANEPWRSRWGLRFGEEKSRPTAPKDIADVLEPRKRLPVVVSLAACDSANQASPLAGDSLAQELHRRGIPVVVASQLPLTKGGATLMTEHLYERVLTGEDVRSALHEVRARLYEANPQAHDWLSLVAYVRLPHRYVEQLEEVKLRANLAMLEAAHHASLAEASFAEARERLETFGEVEQRIRARIQDLERQYAQLGPDRRSLHEECAGLLASANKRLAELHFARGAKLTGAEAHTQHAMSRQFLEAAWSYYRDGFRSNIHSHWLGAQQLCLEAVLKGAIGQPVDWSAACRAAELDSEKPGEYWGHVSIAELQLLAPIAGQRKNLARARAALEAFKQRVPEANRQHVELTRRQFERYVTWWTNRNGFFPGRADLAEDARKVLSALD